MTGGFFSTRTAALPLFASAILHVLAFAVEGFTAFAGGLLVIGCIYLVLASGLRRGWRWLAWITFLVMLVDMIAAYSIAGQGMHFWWWNAVALADLTVAVILFGALWKSKAAKAGI